MKWMHISDLHLGKRINEFSMIEDQRYILNQIEEIAGEEAVDGLLIAGDVYDKPIPSVEAVGLLDEFLVRLAKRGIAVFLIAGNHDSVQRLSFGNRLLRRGLYIASEYDGTLKPVTVSDRFGEIQVYLLPFVKPSQVRRFFPEEEADSYTQAVAAVLNQARIDPEKRNLLICHQFVTGAVRSESEEVSVGGLDNVDAWVFRGFDYVALGHLHRPQSMADGGLRYCGTPLKYSFSEAGHNKSVTIVEMREKGDVRLQEVLLKPRHDLRRIRGSYLEVTAREFYSQFDREDYIQITLTDEEDVADAVGKLRIIYPHLMQLRYDNQRTRKEQQIDGAQQVEQKSPMQLFEELYELQNNKEMSEEQKAASMKLMEEIWEDTI